MLIVKSITVSHVHPLFGRTIPAILQAVREHCTLAMLAILPIMMEPPSNIAGKGAPWRATGGAPHGHGFPR